MVSRNSSLPCLKLSQYNRIALHINSTNVTPKPTIDTSPPLPAAQALVLTVAPPSDTTAEADADAAADDELLARPVGDPVLVALMLPVADWPPPVAREPPPVGAAALPLPPLLPL